MLRTARAQARRRGWRLVKDGPHVELWGSDDVIPECSGTLTFVAGWLARRSELVAA